MTTDLTKPPDGGRLSRTGIFNPTSITEALSLAKMVSDSDLVPKDYKGKPANILVAWQLGAEIGLQPLQAMQGIAVVNGRPAVWGDTALALVLGSGIVENLSETFEGTGDTLTAVCTLKRRGIEAPTVRRFSVADAKTARLWGKEGPWTQYPKRMLQLRARGFALRDGAADVLKGTLLVEELQGVEIGGEAAPAMPRRASETAPVAWTETPAAMSRTVARENSLLDAGARTVETALEVVLEAEVVSEAPAPAAEPERPAPVPPTIEEATKAPEGEAVLVKAIDAQSGEKNGKPWTLYVVRTQDGRAFKTFNQKHADAATEAKSTGAPLIVTLDVTPRGIMIVGAHVG